MRAFLSWLIDNYLSDLVVLRSEYEHVQNARWQADYYERQAREHAKECDKRLTETMDSMYRDMPFADYAIQSTECVRIEQHEFDAFGYQIRVNRSAFVTRCGFPELAHVKEHFAEKAARAFKEHIRRKLFQLEPNP